MKTGAERRAARQLRYERGRRTPGAPSVGLAAYWLSHGLRWLATEGAAVLVDQRLRRGSVYRGNHVMVVFSESDGAINVPVHPFWHGRFK